MTASAPKDPKKKVAAPKTRSEQLSRFKEMAKELGADEAPDALDRALGQLDTKKKETPQSPRGKTKGK